MTDGLTEIEEFEIRGDDLVFCGTKRVRLCDSCSEEIPTGVRCADCARYLLAIAESGLARARAGFHWDVMNILGPPATAAEIAALESRVAALRAFGTG